MNVTVVGSDSLYAEKEAFKVTMICGEKNRRDLPDNIFKKTVIILKIRNIRVFHLHTNCEPLLTKLKINKRKAGVSTCTR